MRYSFFLYYLTRLPIPSVLNPANFRHILMVGLQHEPDTLPQFEVFPSTSLSFSSELGSISRKSFSNSGMSLPPAVS